MANTLKFGNGQWATGNGTALAYNDENANFKPLPFDFTRASSGTVVNQSGLIETVGSGIPRIDFQGNTKGALLLEPSRTNIITNSNSSNLNFALDGVSMTYNSIISPDGENNGILFRQTGSNSSNSAYNFGLTTSNGTYTYSIFIKANDSEKIRFYSSNGTALTQDFNPQEMTEGVVSGSLNLKFKSYGNDWFRVSFTRTLSSASHHRLSIYPDRNNTQKSVYIFGLQIESNASYATSYIPTSGSAVTRVAETNSETPPSGVIGQTEGTMFVDCKVNAQGTYTGFSLNDNTTNNEVIIRFTTQDRIEYYLRSGGSQPIGGGTTLFDTDKRVKIAFAYKSGDSSVYINGAQVTTSTTTTMPVNLSIIKFARGNSTADFSGKTNDFKVYNTRLSNAELAALTQV
jgi:hypothetical protein